MSRYRQAQELERAIDALDDVEVSVRGAMEDWISHQDTAAALGVTKQRVTQLCEAKKLRCLRDEGGRVRAVHKGDVEARKRREGKPGPNQEQLLSEASHEAEALREEVERLRGERRGVAAALGAQPDDDMSKAARFAVAFAAAAERRAEEAEGRLAVERGWAWEAMGRIQGVLDAPGRAAQALESIEQHVTDWMGGPPPATHPPQQQTPAPARVRELEGRLAHLEGHDANCRCPEVRTSHLGWEHHSLCSLRSHSLRLVEIERRFAPRQGPAIIGPMPGSVPLPGGALPSQEQPADIREVGQRFRDRVDAEGEMVDDDVDPAKWQPGDVVALPLPGSVSWTLLERVERTSWPGWRMEAHGGQSWLPDDLARDQGWRRIRRAGEERRG